MLAKTLGIDIESRNDMERTPLHMAAWHRHTATGRPGCQYRDQGRLRMDAAPPGGLAPAYSCSAATIGHVADIEVKGGSRSQTPLPWQHRMEAQL